MLGRELALLGASTAFMGLPFLPAIREALRPSDSEPLGISKSQLIDPRGDGAQALWRCCSLANVGNPTELAELLASGAAFPLPDGVIALVLPRGGTIAGVPIGFTGTDALSAHPIAIEAGRKLAVKIFSMMNIEVGDGARLVEAHALGELRLGARARLDWWATAARAFLGAGAIAQGSIVASERIELRAGARFHLLRAPLILVAGDGALVAGGGVLVAGGAVLVAGGAASRTAAPESALESWRPEIGARAAEAASAAGARWVVSGDLALPARRELVGNLIVHGNARIGEGARVRGSVKASGSLLVEAGASVTGNAVATRGVRLGEHASVAGCVLGEEWVHLHAGASAGQPARPASVIARQIQLDAGARVHGLARAWKGGHASA